MTDQGWIEKFNLFLGRYTYRQRFIFFSSIFFIATPFPTYWMFKTVNAQIVHWNVVEIGLQAQEALGDVYFSILKGQLLGSKASDWTNSQSNFMWKTVGEKAIQDLQKLRQKDKISMPSLGRGFSTFTPPAIPAEVIGAIWIDFIRLTSEHVNQSSSFLNLNRSFASQISSISEGYGFFLLAPSKQLLITNIAFCRLPDIGRQLLILWWMEPSPDFEVQYQAALSTLKAQVNQISFDLRELRWMHWESSSLHTLEQLLIDQSDLLLLASNAQDRSIFQSRDYLLTTISSLHQLQKDLMKVLDDYRMEQLNSLYQFKDFMFAILLGASIMISCYLIFRVLTRHILRVFKHIRQLSLGHFKAFEYHFSPNDEFYAIGDAFNRMARSLRMISGKLQRLGHLTAESTREVTHSISTQRSIVKHQETQILQSQTVADNIVRNFTSLKKVMSNFGISTAQQISAQLIQSELNDLESRMNRLAADSSAILGYLHDIQRQILAAASLTQAMQKACDQTHLLGLNASIETVYTAPFSHAFAQTTNEIQRFADNALISTQHIQHLIEEISISMSEATHEVGQCLTDVRNGLIRLHQLDKQLGGIARQSEQQTKQLIEIDQLVQDQLSESSEVLSLIGSLKSQAQESSLFLEGLYHAIQNVNLMTVELQKILQRFSVHPSNKGA